jgi:hypothetical protein
MGEVEDRAERERKRKRRDDMTAIEFRCYVCGNESDVI